jgi:hypothetical protein
MISFGRKTELWWEDAEGDVVPGSQDEHELSDVGKDESTI